MRRSSSCSRWRLPSRSTVVAMVVVATESLRVTVADSAAMLAAVLPSVGCMVVPDFTVRDCGVKDSETRDSEIQASETRDSAARGFIILE
jgi:hypothetical protein